MAHRTRKNKLRQKAGTVENVVRVIESMQFPAPNILNERSNYVVVTYWWGRGNQNRNLQSPCPEDVTAEAKSRVMTDIIAAHAKDPVAPGRPTYQNELKAFQKLGQKIRSGRASSVDLANYERLKKEINEWIATLFALPEEKARIQAAYNARLEELRADPSFKPSRPFEDMIREWEQTCAAAGVNYLSVNTEFERADYQNGINAKPLFIKKALDLCKPRGVLYIDGDMWIKKYPMIFDIADVDFMARNWNIDPRAKKSYKEKAHYDPYTFETSGGTMYFGNTNAARKLLDAWMTESSKPVNIGKADDRILSQIFTKDSYAMTLNTIGLPIEYLWLTQNYEAYLTGADGGVSVKDAIIEHPYCLTGEERAASQGAAASRQPEGYTEEIEEAVNYKRPPELIYEFVFFNGDEAKRNEWSTYLSYLQSAKNTFTGQPFVKLVPFAERYGDFNEIADANLAASGQAAPAPPSGITLLPVNAPIPDILMALRSGYDVQLGEPLPNKGPEDEIVAYNSSAETADWYTPKIVLETSKSMFFSAKSPIVIHLLAMCSTLADINKHVDGSYTFLSRIRWNLTPYEQEKPKTAGPKPTAIDLQPIVHQIWFGGDMPEWRKYMFEFNKQVANANGYKYRLWTNADRTKQNFPSTFGYQETAIAKGKETGQNRWAQVADLARLEIVYNNGGIYIDSLFEISNAFFQAIAAAVDDGNLFIGANEDPCDLDCVGNEEKKYLTNSFFAATQYNVVLERLLDDERLADIDFDSEFINRTTGPYYLRSGIVDPVADKVFLFDSGQIYPFNQQATPYKEAHPNPFVVSKPQEGAIQVKEGMYYVPGGLDRLQQNFIVINKGPLATYHSGLGGTWSR